MGTAERPHAPARRLLHEARLRPRDRARRPAELIGRQRALYLGALRDLENVLADGDADATTSLVVEGAALHLEADLKWLDRCEAVLGTETT